MVRLDTTTAGSGLIVTGLTHLLAPRALLTVVRYAYRRVLAADLDADDRTERRVRAIGLVMLAVGTIVAAADRSVSVVAHRT